MGIRLRRRKIQNNKTMKSKVILMSIAAAGLAFAPFVKAEPPVTTTTTTTVSTPGVWTTVPDDFEGDYFIYNNHYYHGGKYEKGDFVWEGRHYHDRYMHDGKWMYGGKWEHHARKAAKEERKAAKEAIEHPGR
jgi:hypothetical protein